MMLRTVILTVLVPGYGMYGGTVGEIPRGKIAVCVNYLFRPVSMLKLAIGNAKGKT